MVFLSCVGRVRRIAAFNLQLNNRLDDRSVIYTVTPDSQVVLEPFRLVSVTEAVEAAGCIDPPT